MLCQALNAEADWGIRDGTLYDAKEANRVIGGAARAMRENAMRMPRQWARELAGRNEGECFEILERAVRELLRDTAEQMGTDDAS